jgi:hypothetical protein
MEFGAIFILVVFVAVIAVLAALLLGVASALRRGKLHPQGDKVEGRGHRASGEEQRPRHTRVRSGQRTRFIADR